MTKIEDEDKLKYISVKELQDTIEAASMGIWRIELFEGQAPRMKATPKMRELLGLVRDAEYTDEEVYDAWYKGICPESLPSVENSVNKMLSGIKDENTYRWKHPRLGERYVRCGGTAHRVEGEGNVLIGYHYDVTEQVSEEKKASLVIDSLAKTYACLFYIDFANFSYTSYYSDIQTVSNIIRDKGDLIQGFDNFVKYLCNPGDAEKIRQFTCLSTLNKRLKDKNTISIEFRGVTREWCEVSFIVCDRHEDGTISHFIMGVKDISKQKKKELEQFNTLRENVEANKAKTMMLQNMTHEIRTPLNAMFGFSQLLSMPDGSTTASEKEEYFNYIYNSFNMLSMFIDDVLDMADAEHGNYRIVKSTVHINDVCRKAIQMAEIRKPADVNMFFSTDLSDNFTLESDERRIQQILINLLVNACKHTNKGEIQLHVSNTEVPNRITLSVRDTGEGIPTDMQDKIFNRYQKANDKVQGSGLGLNICTVIAEKLGGEVKLDKTYTNGARFMLVL